MAVNRELMIDVVCDGCGCSEPYSGPCGDVTFDELEQRARDEGWQILLGKPTWCDDCVKDNAPF